MGLPLGQLLAMTPAEIDAWAAPLLAQQEQIISTIPRSRSQGEAVSTARKQDQVAKVNEVLRKKDVPSEAKDILLKMQQNFAAVQASLDKMAKAKPR